MREFGKRFDGPGGRRTAAREPVLLTAALLTVGCSRPVIIIDLSVTGAHLQINETMRLGQEVWIKAAPVEVFGTVAWVDGDQFGVAFDDPIGADQLALLQARGGVTPSAGNRPDERLAGDDWDSGLAR